MPGTVVLLGAGASVPAQLPTAAELTLKALETAAGESKPALGLALNFVVSSLTLGDSRRGGSATVVPDIERLVSAVKMLSDREELEAAPFVVEWDAFISQLERRPGAGKSAQSRLEREITKLIDDARKGATRNPGMLRGGDRNVAKNVAASIQDVAQAATAQGRRDIFDELHSWLLGHVVRELQITDPAITDYLTPLARWAAGPDGGLVGTLNYDLTLEHASDRAGVRYRRGVENWYSTGRLDSFEPGTVEMVKLHGSLDWTISGDSLNVHPNAQQPFQQSAAPGIIYGRRDKLRPAGPFLQMLERFRDALMSADNLVLIGYSFRDAHIDTLIERWLRVRPQARALTVEHPAYVLPADTFSSSPNRATGRHSKVLLRLWHGYGPSRWEYVRSADANNPARRRASDPVRFAISRTGAGSALSTLDIDGMDRFINEQFNAVIMEQKP